MKIFNKAKDGGNDSSVTGYWLIESKKYFSIVILRFEKGSREAYHTHAFNALSWVLKGHMVEEVKETGNQQLLFPSFRPIITKRNRFHKVTGYAPNTWAISFRGPWIDKWEEYLPNEDRYITLTHGRKVVNASE